MADDENVEQQLGGIFGQHATLADSFMDDLEDDVGLDMIVGEEEEQEQMVVDEGDEPILPEDLEPMADAIDDFYKLLLPTRSDAMNGDDGGIKSLSKFLYDDEFLDLMETVRAKKDEPVDPNETEVQRADCERLVDKCNRMVPQITEEIRLIYTHVRDIYCKRFPELEKAVVGALDYMRVVERLGNSLDIDNCEPPLNDFLPNNLIITLKVQASASTGSSLPQHQMEDALRNSRAAFDLSECQADCILFVQSRMTSVAPNLSALLGPQLAAELIAAAGSLGELATMPSGNIEKIGSFKKTTLGMSGAAGGVHQTGLLWRLSDLVSQVTGEYKTKCIRMLTGKTGIAARCDWRKTSPLGEDGAKLRQQVLDTLRKHQMPPPARHKKALPLPIETSKPKRGGKRHRRMKEKYGQSDLQKAANRLKFGEEAEEEFSQEKIGVGLGTIGRETGGKIRATQEKNRKTEAQQAAERRRRQAAASAGASVSGLASSLAFATVQGIELVNPEIDRQARKKQDGTDYFSKTSGFQTYVPAG